MQLCNLSFYHWLFCCDSLCKYGFGIISIHTIKTMSTTLRFQLICVYIPYCKFEIATVIIIDYNQFERSSRIDALSHHIRSSHPLLPTDATSPPPLSSSLTLTFFPSFPSVTPSDCLSIRVYFFRAVCWSVHHFLFLFSFHHFSPSFSLPFVPSRPSPPPFSPALPLSGII